ncbi:MAG: hypothetical protein IJ433_09295, partial [Ruminococcus sp.]|nr:hypothetical protein [Ruminococcus sp.]
LAHREDLSLQKRFWEGVETLPYDLQCIFVLYTNTTHIFRNVFRTSNEFPLTGEVACNAERVAVPA